MLKTCMQALCVLTNVACSGGVSLSIVPIITSFYITIVAQFVMGELKVAPIEAPTWLVFI